MWQQKNAACQQKSNDQLLARKLAEQATDPVEKLRYLCLARGASGILVLGRLLRHMDDNGSRFLSYEELEKGIAASGLQLAEKELKALLSRFDKDRKKSIDISEFLLAIRPPMSPKRIQILKEAFQKMDQDGDGEITLYELKKTYTVDKHPRYLNGDESKEEVLKILLDVFELDDNMDGRVTEEEFMNYYAAISTSIDQDVYFDLLIRQAFKL